MHVDDLGRPALAPVAALTLVERLVQPDRGHRPVAGRVVDQHLTEQHHGVVHGVPITGQVVGDLGHCPTVFADLTCRPSRRPRGQRRSFRRDRRVVLAPRHDGTTRARATPALLAPRQPCRTPKHRQVNQQHFALAVIPRRRPTPRTGRSRRARLDLDPQPQRPLTNPTDHHVRQANKQHAHARRIGFQQGLLDIDRRKTPSALQSPCPTPGTHSTLKSEAPLWDNMEQHQPTPLARSDKEEVHSSILCSPTAKHQVDDIGAPEKGVFDHHRSEITVDGRRSSIPHQPVHAPSPFWSARSARIRYS